jgi:phosphomannomutase
MNILLDDFKAYGQQVIDELTAYVAEQPGWSLAPNNFEGVRVNLDEAHGNGWFLLRLSLHDPLLPLNIESNDVGGVKIIANELAAFVAAYDKLDSAKLQEFAK